MNCSKIWGNTVPSFTDLGYDASMNAINNATPGESVSAVLSNDVWPYPPIINIPLNVEKDSITVPLNDNIDFVSVHYPNNSNIQNYGVEFRFKESNDTIPSDWMYAAKAWEGCNPTTPNGIPYLNYNLRPFNSEFKWKNIDKARFACCFNDTTLPETCGTFKPGSSKCKMHIDEYCTKNYNDPKCINWCKQNPDKCRAVGQLGGYCYDNMDKDICRSYCLVRGNDCDDASLKYCENNTSPYCGCITASKDLPDNKKAFVHCFSPNCYSTTAYKVKRMGHENSCQNIDCSQIVNADLKNSSFDINSMTQYCGGRISQLTPSSDDKDPSGIIGGGSGGGSLKEPEKRMDPLFLPPSITDIVPDIMANMMAPDLWLIIILFILMIVIVFIFKSMKKSNNYNNNNNLP